MDSIKNYWIVKLNRLMLSKSFKITALVVIAMWITTMSYLFGKKGNEIVKSNIDVTKLGNISGLAGGTTEYLGIYFQDKKIGYVVNKTDKTDESIFINHHSELNLTVQGSQRKAIIDGSLELTKDFFLRKFYFNLNTENQEFIVVGKSENNKLMINSNLADFKELEIDNTSPVFLDVIINRYIARKALSNTKRFSFKVFSLDGLKTDIVEVEVLGQKRIKVLDEELFATHIKKRFKNLTIDSYIDLNGKTIMEKNELGFSLIRENPENIRTDFVAFDIISHFSILPDKNIPDIFGISELKVRFPGIEIDKGLEGGRQSISNGVLIIKREPLSQKAESLHPDDLKRYTSEEPFIQSNSQEIIALAKRIAEESKDQLESLEKINHYLFTSIKKKNIIGIPDAKSTLKNMEGDCNEHTMLFVALARSIGIPARPVGGIAYLNGRFYFHSWVEAYINGWRTYDPTWGQSPADVGHIRLVSGGIDKILDITKYINRLNIEVIEWK